MFKVVGDSLAQAPSHTISRCHAVILSCNLAWAREYDHLVTLSIFPPFAISIRLLLATVWVSLELNSPFRIGLNIFPDVNLSWRILRSSETCLVQARLCPQRCFDER